MINIPDLNYCEKINKFYAPTLVSITLAIFSQRSLQYSLESSSFSSSGLDIKPHSIISDGTFTHFVINKSPSIAS